MEMEDILLIVRMSRFIMGLLLVDIMVVVLVLTLEYGGLQQKDLLLVEVLLGKDVLVL